MRTIDTRIQSFSQASTYGLAALFVLGNLIVPQLFHSIPRGGAVWLPIYLFTLIGAWRCGWQTGIITAVASPLLNHVIFGMPPAGALTAIILKSTVLALAAGYLSAKSQRVTIGGLALAVAACQIIGTLGEWAIAYSFWAAIQDFRIGIPGMLLQIFGGYLILKLCENANLMK